MRFLTLLFSSFLTLLTLGAQPTERTLVYSYQTAVSNVHIVQQGETLLMIDSGTAAMRKGLGKFLAEEGLDFADIDYLILTHATPDHAGSAAYLQETYGTKVIVGQGDEALLTRGELTDVCFTNVASRGLWTSLPHRFKPLEADIWIDDTVDMKPWGIEGKLYPLGEQTEGSLIVEIGRHAFVGDLVRGRPANKTRPARHYFVCDLEKNRQDILRLCEREHLHIWFTGRYGELDPAEVAAEFR